MKNFINLLRKDFLLLIRDFWGVVLLFLMPWALVLMMTYLQDSTFRSINENRVPLYLLNNDGDSLGNMVSRHLLTSNIFEVSTTSGGRVLSAGELEEAVSRGDYLIGVIIPEHATERLREKVRLGIEKAFNGDNVSHADDNDGNGNSLSHVDNSDGTRADALPEIRILIDPKAKQSFRTSLIRAVRENALRVQNRLLLGEITRQVNRIVPIPVNLDMDTDELITIRESYAQSNGTDIIPDSTQHNVPAWSMFAIFFIVISLAGNMIGERETGCFNRLMTMPFSFRLYILSKVSVYLCVCMLQLALMILTGMYAIPLLGLPVLKLGHSLFALIAMSVSSSLAAIGYGLAIGSIARTNQQASVFGAVSVVILAAIGGVWIPTFIMPRFMQTISNASPLNWGLNGFHEIFVRDAGFSDILPYVSASLLFFILTLAISCRSNRKRRM
ncbi:MAG: ABC transporter permease [Tannerella sp.]|jgi:ABC-2 type transport system permease protein|nr:ABC transporter permease [Tannerella sp.]